MPGKRSLPRHVLDDLKRSGLTDKDAQRLGVVYIDEESTKELMKEKDTDAYRIPYFDIDGKRIDFHRYRLMNPKKGFDGKINKKYVQPPDTLPRFYLPPLSTPWRKVAKDADTALYITEGEKKAACACKHGLPTIGLGGVWSWRAAKKGVARINDFNLFIWKGRRIYIVFDSDVVEKAEVQAAMVALSDELTMLGALPIAIKLPSKGKDKQGLDDYLVSHKLEQFQNLPQEELNGGLAQELHEMNQDFKYIQQINAIYQVSSNRIMKEKGAFVNMALANRKAQVVVDGKMKEINLGEAWLKWPFRQTHTRLVYAPGEPRELADGSYNTWTGWQYVPKKGDVKMFVKLVDYLTQGLNAEQRRWFWQWLAYPIQHPGAKLYAAIVLYGRAQGTGKSLLGYTLGNVYGENFKVITQKQLQSDYTGWLANKQFILGNEVSGSDSRKDADLAKNLISEEIAEINIKYIPQYDVRCCANFLFTSNHLNAFYLEDDDRRMFVHEVPDETLPREFYDRYDKWYRTPEAASAVMWYLLNKVSLKGFNPHAKPPMTEAKQQVIASMRSHIDEWVNDLKNDPDTALTVMPGSPPSKRELWTAAQLASFYNTIKNQNVSSGTMGRALHRAGLKNKEIGLANRSVRLYAIRAREKWAREVAATWRVEYEKGQGGDGEKGARVIPFPRGGKARPGGNDGKKKF